MGGGGRGEAEGGWGVESIEQLRFLTGNTTTGLTYSGTLEPLDKLSGEARVSPLMDDPEVLPGLEDDGFLPLARHADALQVLPVAETGPDGLPDLRGLAAGLLPAGERMALYLSDGLFGAGHPDPMDGGRGPDPWG